MNKKVLLLTASLLSLVMLATPVLAAPAERINVTLVLTKIADAPPEKTWLTNRDISFQIGLNRNFSIVVTIPGDDPLEGEIYSIRSTIRNRKTEVLIVHMDMVFTVTGDGGVGTFEGRYKGVVSDFTPPPQPPTGDTVVYYVLHGTGDFTGQTLMFTYVGPIPIAGKVVSGVLIRPKG